MRKVQHERICSNHDAHVSTFVPPKKQNCPLTSSGDKLYDTREFDVPTERNATATSIFQFRRLSVFFFQRFIYFQEKKGNAEFCIFNLLLRKYEKGKCF